MKRYIIVAITSFLLASVSYLAFNWSIARGSTFVPFRYIAMAFVLVFIGSLFAIFLKLVFRNGVKKFNL